MNNPETDFDALNSFLESVRQFAEPIAKDRGMVFLIHAQVIGTGNSATDTNVSIDQVAKFAKECAAAVAVHPEVRQAIPATSAE